MAARVTVMNVDKMRHQQTRIAERVGPGPKVVRPARWLPHEQAAELREAQRIFLRGMGEKPYLWGGVGPEGHPAGELSDAVIASFAAGPFRIGSTATNPNPSPVEPEQPRIWPDGYAIVPAGWGTVADLLAWMEAEGIPLSAELSTNMTEEVSLEWLP